MIQWSPKILLMFLNNIISCVKYNSTINNSILLLLMMNKRRVFISYSQKQSLNSVITTYWALCPDTRDGFYSENTMTTTKHHTFYNDKIVAPNISTFHVKRIHVRKIWGQISTIWIITHQVEQHCWFNDSCGEGDWKIWRCPSSDFPTRQLMNDSLRKNFFFFCFY